MIQTDTPKPTAIIQIEQPKATSYDFDKEIIIPLREKQAEAAKAAHEADLARTRDRVKPFGTYSSSYSFGNCTSYVASRIKVPNSWGNARTWYSSAQAAGWQVGLEPRVGAIATTQTGYYGHVAIVEQISGSQVLVSEMNYAGFNIISQRWTSIQEFVYIY